MSRARENPRARAPGGQESERGIGTSGAAQAAAR
jgi:hypothetical protein